MTDGGLGDSIPVIRAYEQGARDITVVLSRPRGYRKHRGRTPRLIQQFFHDHSRLFEAVLARGERYNRALDFIESPPADCRISVIAPPADFAVSRFTREEAQLEVGYQVGCRKGSEYLQSLQPAALSALQGAPVSLE